MRRPGESAAFLAQRLVGGPDPGPAPAPGAPGELEPALRNRHRKRGGFCGYRVHAAVCARTDLRLLARWRFAGPDAERGATKWRCPTGECKPASRWVKADRLHPLIPRETLRWGRLYADRYAVERAFGRAKHE